MGQIIGYIIFTVLILYTAKNYLDKKGHPKALFYLFFAEMWERFILWYESTSHSLSNKRLLFEFRKQ